MSKRRCLEREREQIFGQTAGLFRGIVVCGRKKVDGSLTLSAAVYRIRHREIVEGVVTHRSHHRAGEKIDVADQKRDKDLEKRKMFHKIVLC